MFHVAFPRGRGPAFFADLPPTLQPRVIAASAPPSDHMRAAALSGLIYFSLGAAMVAFSNLSSPPSLVPVPHANSGPAVVYEPARRFRVTLPQPGLIRGGHAEAQPGLAVPQAAPTEVPVVAPAGLPTEDHQLDPVGTGTGTPGAAAPPGAMVVGATGGPVARDFTATGLAVLHQVDPIYPDFARRAHIQGAVVLLMTVDERGQPIQVQVVEGHPVFHEAARSAARQWRFEPAQMDGRPVPAAFRLTLKFFLR